MLPSDEDLQTCFRWPLGQRRLVHEYGLTIAFANAGAFGAGGIGMDIQEWRNKEGKRVREWLGLSGIGAILTVLEGV